MITLGALMPHPPIIVEGVGQSADHRTAARTIRAMHEVNRILSEDPPATLVIFTPHGTVYQDAIIVYGDPHLSGDLRRFGAGNSFGWSTDRELAEEINRRGREAGLPVYLMEQRQAAGGRFPDGLDHGVIVPLSFCDPAWVSQVKLVVIPMSFLPREELYQFGGVVRDAVNRLGRKAAIIASGDLSHCLTADAPAGYNPRGAEFDRTLMELIGRSDVPEIMELDPVLQEKAAECGFRSLIMLLGAFDQVNFQSEVLSYEGPFGVGYGVAVFRPQGERSGYVADFFSKRYAAVAERKAKESPLVQFARSVVESHIAHKPLPAPEGLESFAPQRAGVFVSLKKHGQLRGCIGTIEPTAASIIAEVEQNAISAATRDPRFEPVAENELPDLVYSVDVLQPAERIRGLEELDPHRYGVIVKQGRRQGLLLPNLEGIDTPAEQVAIAKRKAGIGADEAVELERFEVVRYY
jgi:AmmeMemoRadiSam system protein A